MADAARGGELALEPFHFGTQDELLAVADARDGCQHVLANRGILGL